jgi:hypothetical protein
MSMRKQTARMYSMYHRLRQVHVQSFDTNRQDELILMYDEPRNVHLNSIRRRNKKERNRNRNEKAKIHVMNMNRSMSSIIIASLHFHN